MAPAGFATGYFETDGLVANNIIRDCVIGVATVNAWISGFTVSGNKLNNNATGIYMMLNNSYISKNNVDNSSVSLMLLYGRDNEITDNILVNGPAAGVNVGTSNSTYARNIIRDTRTTTTTSATSMAPALGSKSFTVSSGLGFVPGQSITITSTGDTSVYMIGSVTSYSSTTLVAYISTSIGSSTRTDWVLTLPNPTHNYGFTVGDVAGNTLVDNIISGYKLGTLFLTPTAFTYTVAKQQRPVPASSSVQCSKGDWAEDSNYLYYAKPTDQWTYVWSRITKTTSSF